MKNPVRRYASPDFDINFDITFLNLLGINRHDLALLFLGHKKLKALKTLSFQGFLAGAPAEIRTPDTLLKRQIKSEYLQGLRRF